MKNQETWILVLVLAFSGYTSLGKSPDLSGHWFPSVKMRQLYKIKVSFQLWVKKYSMLREFITELKSLSQEARRQESHSHCQNRHENWWCQVTSHKPSHVSVATKAMWLTGMSYSGDLIISFLTTCVCAYTCVFVHIRTCVYTYACMCMWRCKRQASVPHDMWLLLERRLPSA